MQVEWPSMFRITHTWELDPRALGVQRHCKGIMGVPVWDSSGMLFEKYPHELLSKLLVSPLITPIVVPYIIPYITPLLRSLDYGSHVPARDALRLHFSLSDWP